MNNLWPPTATIENLHKRAKLLASIRQFFAERDVLEIETPVLSHASIPTPYIKSIETKSGHYLQTSPEFHMKRLLAAGSGSIYTITKSFRDEEQGRHHNCEFTMLEWYRLGFDHHALMDEMCSLLQTILKTQAADRISYQDLFIRYLDIDPHSSTVENLQKAAKDFGIQYEDEFSDKDDWLTLLMSHIIEPQLGIDKPIFIYDYPASQSALTKIRPDNPPVAERFEVYFQGVELANGFHELTDAQEQQKRFEQDLEKRKQLGLATIPIDTHFINALKAGLPACAGVALGVDRLVMLALGVDSINQVLSFTSENA